MEDVEHFLLRCTGMAEEREKLIRLMKDRVVEWQIGNGPCPTEQCSEISCLLMAELFVAIVHD